MKAPRSVAAACMVLCCALTGLGGWVAAAPGAGEAALRDEPVAEVLVSADGRTLSASVTGFCLPSAGLSAQETRDAVTVRLAGLPRGDGAGAAGGSGIESSTCTSGMGARTYTVALPEPLGARRVVDASDGLGVPVFDERSVLRPGALPAGYVHVYDAALYGDGDGRYGSNWDASCTQVFADAQGDLLWITQSHGKHWPDGWGPSLPLAPVRHSVARYRTGMLAWQEDGESFVLSSTPVLSAPLSTTQLVAIAEGLSVSHSR